MEMYDVIFQGYGSYKRNSVPKWLKYIPKQDDVAQRATTLHTHLLAFAAVVQKDYDIEGYNQ